MDCINLRERFGRRYRTEYEESHYADRGAGVRTDDPWMHVILCKYGQIYPHGGNLLAVSVDGHPKIASQIRRLSCCQLQQEGDVGELTAIFDTADFDQVAQVMKPRKRRQLSEAQRTKLIEAGAKSRFHAA